MLLHVYQKSGIRSARFLPFWESFRALNPDVELSAQDLRMMFFGEVLHEAEYYEDLPYGIVQYMNPIFNQIPIESLEFGDLGEGEDFVLNIPQGTVAGGIGLEEFANYVNAPLPAAPNIPMAPLSLNLVNASHPTVVPPPTTAINNEEDELCKGFARLLSELVWTNEEAIEKPVLPIPELRERVSALTKAGISLCDLLDPGMSFFKPQRQQDEPSKTRRPEIDQLVPAVPIAHTVPTVSETPAAAKRFLSFDDSGLGLSPSKRARLITPSTMTARKQKLKRIASAPTES